MKRIVLCMAVACVSGLMPPLTWAQEQAVEQESKRATEKAQRTSRRAHYPPQIFRLKHADCFEVAEVLGRVARDATALPIRRGNCIVYAGPADTLEAVRGLVEELDTPATDAEAGHLEIVKILHRNAEELADQVARILSSRDFRVAADESRSSILLRGSGYAIESALDLIKQLDTPAPGVSLEFAFFHADLNSDEDQGPIPTDLADVAKELRRFGGLRLVGRLSAVATEHEEFAVEGAIARSVSARIAGAVDSASADGTVRMTVKADMMLDRERDQGGDKTSKGGPRPAFELDTMVTASRGDYVVLGSAPTGWGPGESAILVLHVRP